VGTHIDLLAKEGLYSDMWIRQQEAAGTDSVGGSAATSRAGSRVQSTADLQKTEADATGREQKPPAKSNLGK